MTARQEDYIFCFVAFMYAQNMFLLVTSHFLSLVPALVSYFKSIQSLLAGQSSVEMAFEM